MKTNECNTVDLVSLRDSNYRAVCREHAARHNELRQRRDPFAADFTRYIASYEEAFRKILANIFLSTEDRILKHSSPDHKQCFFGYREVDFIAVTNAEPTLFVELKFKEKFNEHRYFGVGQLRKSLEIGRSRWGSLRGLCINIFMGSVYGLTASEPAAVLPFDAIYDSRLQTRVSDQITALWISGEDFMRRCTAEGLMLGKREELRRARSTAKNPLLELQTSAKNDFGTIGSQVDWKLAI